MLTRAHVENIIGFCTGKANMQEFQSYTAPGFVFEIMGTQAAGEWHGIEVKRQFEAFKENFTSEFQFNASGIYVDSEKKTAAVRLHSLPLTDKGAAATNSTVVGSYTSTMRTRSPESFSTMTPNWWTI